jgi:hypothetical protein
MHPSEAPLGVWGSHKYFVALYFHRISEQFVAFTSGVSAIGRVKAIFVVWANDAAQRVYPSIA